MVVEWIKLKIRHHIPSPLLPSKLKVSGGSSARNQNTPVRKSSIDLAPDHRRGQQMSTVSKALRFPFLLSTKPTNHLASTDAFCDHSTYLLCLSTFRDLSSGKVPEKVHHAVGSVDTKPTGRTGRTPRKKARAFGKGHFRTFIDRPFLVFALKVNRKFIRRFRLTLGESNSGRLLPYLYRRYTILHTPPIIRTSSSEQTICIYFFVLRGMLLYHRGHEEDTWKQEMTRKKEWKQEMRGKSTR